MSAEGRSKILTGTLMKTQSVVVPVIQKISKTKKEQPVGLQKGLLLRVSKKQVYWK